MRLEIHKKFILASSLICFTLGRSVLFGADVSCATSVSSFATLEAAIIEANTSACNLSITGDFTLSNDTTAITQGTGTIIWESSSPGTERIIISGGHTLITINGAIVSLSSDIRLRAGSISVTSGTLEMNAGRNWNQSGIKPAFTLNSSAILDFNVSNFFGSNLSIDGNSTIKVQADQLINTTTACEISGTGNLTKSGLGQLTISSTTNTHSGSVSITEGILALNAGGILSSASGVSISSGATFDIADTTSGATVTNLSGSGTLQLGAKNLTVDLSADTTFSGAIQGTGSIIKNDNFIWELSGTSTYSGGTTLNAGQIRVAGNSALGTGALSVANGTTLGLASEVTAANNIGLTGLDTIYVASGSAALTGVISGDGAFTKTGSGTLVLSGNNLYAGGTLLSAGQLTVESSSALGTAGLSVAASSVLSLYPGVLVSNQVALSGASTINVSSDKATLSQEVSGIGASFTKIGSGTLALGGTNTFTGGTTLSSGGIQMQANRALGSGALSMGSGTTLILDSGLSVENTIALGGSSTIETSSGTATLVGVITGFGSLTKTGDGILVLEADSTFSGGTTLTEGTLSVLGTLDSAVIATGGTLKGIGTVTGNSTMQSSSTLAPGTSPGEITMDGNLVFETGSILEIAVSSTEASLLTVTGALTIESGSYLYFNVDSASDIIGDSFTFIDADSITGTFTSISSAFPLLGSDVIYTNMTVGVDTATVDFSRLQFSEILPGSNALNVGKAIEEIEQSGNTSFNSIFDSLVNLRSVSEIKAALNEMQPALYKGLAISQENNAARVRDTLGYRFEQVLNEMYCYQPRASRESEKNSREEKKGCHKQDRVIHLWVDGFGDNLHQNSNTYANSAQFGYQTNTAGVVLGLDGRFAEYFYFGGLGAYTDSDIKWSLDQGKGDISSGYGGIYLSGISEVFYLNLSMIGAWSHYKAHRNISYTGVNETASNTHGGAQLISHADTGINLGYGGFTFRPFDSFDYIAQSENRFTETGAGILNLTVNKINLIMIRNEVGAQFSGCLCFGGSRWTVAPKISWVREMRLRGEGYTAQFINTEVPFQVTGYFANRNLVAPGMLLTGLMLQDRLALNLYYNGEFGEDFSDQSYGGQINFGF